MNLLAIKATDIIAILSIISSAIISIKSIHNQKKHEYKMIFYKEKMQFLIELNNALSDMEQNTNDLLESNYYSDDLLFDKYKENSNRLLYLYNKSDFFLNEVIVKEIGIHWIDNKIMIENWEKEKGFLNFNIEKRNKQLWNLKHIKKLLIEEKDSFMKKR